MTTLPNMVPVKSSNVMALGFSPQGLFVQFHKSGVYQYPAVPETLYLEGLQSDSVGGWLRSKVMGKYEG